MTSPPVGTARRDRVDAWIVRRTGQSDRVRAGASHADLSTHFRARIVLTTLATRDPDVQALHARWDQDLPFGRAAVALEQHLARVAAEDGFPSVAALLDAARAAEEEHPHRFGRVIRDDAGLVGAYAEALEAFELNGPYDEAARLVRVGWGLPWPWIAEEVVSLWFERQLFGVWGESIGVRVEVRELGRPAPPISFTTRPGESAAAALARCQSEVLAPLLAAVRADERPPGKRAPTDVIDRYVVWWYRHRVRRESIRQIAGKVDDRRSLVRRGIARASRWLAVAEGTWDDEGGGPPGNGSASE